MNNKLERYMLIAVAFSVLIFAFLYFEHNPTQPRYKINTVSRYRDPILLDSFSGRTWARVYCPGQQEGYPMCWEKMGVIETPQGK